MDTPHTAQSNAPIGVFDSGIGGLSVLRALRTELPHERFVYVADSAHAPYGEREAARVRDRALQLTQELVEHHHIKALVVACNTATAVAIADLRALHPQLPIVGVEPALKPAAAQSRTRRVGVLATRGTLQSDKYRALQRSLQEQAEFVDMACDGLAAAIEADDAEKTDQLCREYLAALGPLGNQPGDIDTLVLGCTHYPFVSNTLRKYLAPGVELLESGAPVARQTRRLLEGRHLLATHGSPSDVMLQATGSADRLKWAAAQWLL